ncbi:hypothetical protein [Tissierella creatinophila]|uniref:Uncharacterized protein n=1 Tax=Tissierella creatinophila DSM 6911 TaxID=1123403 RepID=A0A1U7M6H5_TISCR|nr:hypothetical protein [Tissierella creatinophila]OLS02907.1 hypothetical protein TICRE_10610 [Tissierella creatinophila DSM 6911]
MQDKQVIIAVKRTIRKFRFKDNISAIAQRELEIVLRNIKRNEKEPTPTKEIGS